MKHYSKYYLLESGELLNIGNEFRKEFIAKRTETLEYIRGFGADAYSLSMSNQLRAVRFKGGIRPQNFKTPGLKGFCEPYKRSHHFHDFKKYAMPSVSVKIQRILGCPISLKFKSASKLKGVISGEVTIGKFTNPIDIHWYSENGPLLLCIPDGPRKYEDLVARYGPNIVIINNDHLWAMPSNNGTRKILVEEWDLMVVQYNKAKKEVVSNG